MDNRGYEVSLAIGKVYPVLPRTAALPRGWIRVIDESGEDYAFPERRFVTLKLPPRARRAIAGSVD